MFQLLISTLQDVAVYSKNMVAIGKVKDIEVNLDDMKVTYLILELERQATKELFDKRIVLRHSKGKVPTALIEKVGEAVVLKHPMAELKGLIEHM